MRSQRYHIGISLINSEDAAKGTLSESVIKPANDVEVLDVSSQNARSPNITERDTAEEISKLRTIPDNSKQGAKSETSHRFISHSEAGGES